MALWLEQLNSKTLKMVNELLYDFFVFHKSPLSYKRIKDFLAQFESEKAPIQTLYRLMATGVVEGNRNQKYELAQTAIVQGTNFDYAVNINFDYKQKLLPFIESEIPGAIILKKGYPHDHILKENVRSFHFKGILNNLTPLEDILLKNTNPDGEELRKSRISFNHISNTFNSDSEGGSIGKAGQLYKVIYSKYFFKYQFRYNDTFYTFQRTDFEMVSACKLLLQIGSSGKVKYIRQKSHLQLMKLSLPNYIVKLLTLNHCLQKGCFPTDFTYYIDSTDLNHLNKTYFKNKLTIKYE